MHNTLKTNTQKKTTVLKSVQTIYDRSPKLRIKGSGFDADDHAITLDISAQGQTSLRADKVLHMRNCVQEKHTHFNSRISPPSFPLPLTRVAKKKS